jgi:hypothetical protein
VTRRENINLIRGRWMKAVRLTVDYTTNCGLWFYFKCKRLHSCARRRLANCFIGTKMEFKAPAPILQTRPKRIEISSARRVA